MGRKAVSGMMLTLLSISMLTLAFNVESVEVSGTIYIRADGSVDPPTAPISSVDNNTYIFIDNINDSIVVERDNIVVDGAHYTVQGTGSGSGIDLSGRSNVTVENMEIRRFDPGIYLEYSFNNTLSGNKITNNGIGVLLERSSGNTVSRNNMANNICGIYHGGSSSNSLSKNNITANDSDGIYLVSSSSNSISENSITDNGHGIHLEDFSDDNSISRNNIANNYAGIWLECSSNNILWSNSMAKNEYNFKVWGVNLSEFVNDVNASNTVDGRPVYYWLNKRDMDVPLDAGCVALVDCTRITVQNLNLTNNGQGLLLAYTTNSTISKNNVTNNRDGIWLQRSSNNSISGNNITANSCWGILLDCSSGNSISGNNVTNNGEGAWLESSSNNSISRNNITANFGFGIWLYDYSNYNRICGNDITANNWDGIALGGSSNNSILGNNIAKNQDGICLSGSSNYNRISANNMTANKYYGIKLLCSSNNVIYHNNFVDNTEQVHSYDSTNAWDDGYPSGGNYWSDYSDTDSYNGPYQNETGSDGIGDTPYVIDVENQDHYPLTKPWIQSEHEPVTPVGVKAGDWIRYDYTVTGAPPGTPLPTWMKVEFLSVKGTTATVEVTIHMSDGTEQHQTMTIDIVAGEGTLGAFSGFIIPANTTTGDSIYISGYGSITIAGETTRMYVGASRTVVYVSFSQYGAQLTYYWDKQTGVMVEASVTSVGMTGSAKATETNMWQARPFGLPMDPTLYALTIVVIAIVIATLLGLIVYRRTPESQY